MIKYCLPTWFAHIEALIKIEKFPVYFCIQTPRVVPSLQYLYVISLDEFKSKLSDREITLHDVESDGYSILHVRRCVAARNTLLTTAVLSGS